MPRRLHLGRFDKSGGQSDKVARAALLQLVWEALRTHSAMTLAIRSAPLAACDPSGACVGWGLTVSRSARRCGRGKCSAAPTRKQQGLEVLRDVQRRVVVGGDAPAVLEWSL